MLVSASLYLLSSLPCLLDTHRVYNLQYTLLIIALSFFGRVG